MLESPAWFRVAYRAGQIARRMVGKAKALPYRDTLPNRDTLPERSGLPLVDALALLPASLPAPVALPAIAPAIGTRRARVALLAGCVQQALRPSINVATIRVLTVNGVEVVTPADQGCCGALALHAGHDAHATMLAAHNARVFPGDVDAIITNAAGCGSAMKERGGSVPVLDVAEFLDSLGLRTSHELRAPTLVAYHDACHLSHGQGIRLAPRRLLQQIDNVSLVEIPDGDVCCGSAGLYNVEQPVAARALGRRKAEAIRQTGAALVAAGNIGCLTQIEAYLEIPVRHTIELLDSAIVSREN
jgi:glycolate oxidase iron-sulfur subunit